jgi:hypothetical protein
MNGRRRAAVKTYAVCPAVSGISAAISGTTRGRLERSLRRVAMRRLRTFHAIVFATCAAAFAPAALAVSAGDYFAEAGIGALCECVAIGGGVAVMAARESHSEITVNYLIAGVIIATYPAAAATGVYLMGEAVDGPSANKGAAWGVTALASYGVSAVLWIGSVYLGGGYIGPAADVVLAKPFLTPLIYHAVKKPASAGESRGPALEPYVAAARGSDGEPVPLYGVTFAF